MFISTFSTNYFRQSCSRHESCYYITSTAADGSTWVTINFDDSGHVSCGHVPISTSTNHHPPRSYIYFSKSDVALAYRKSSRDAPCVQWQGNRREYHCAPEFSSGTARDAGRRNARLAGYEPSPMICAVVNPTDTRLFFLLAWSYRGARKTMARGLLPFAVHCRQTVFPLLFLETRENAAVRLASETLIPAIETHGSPTGPLILNLALDCSKISATKFLTYIKDKVRVKLLYKRNIVTA